MMILLVQATVLAYLFYSNKNLMKNKKKELKLYFEINRAGSASCNNYDYI